MLATNWEPKLASVSPCADVSLPSKVEVTICPTKSLVSSWKHWLSYRVAFMYATIVFSLVETCMDVCPRKFNLYCGRIFNLLPTLSNFPWTCQWYIISAFLCPSSVWIKHSSGWDAPHILNSTGCEGNANVYMTYTMTCGSYPMNNSVFSFPNRSRTDKGPHSDGMLGCAK